jgi:hypothetical protein
VSCKSSSKQITDNSPSLAVLAAKPPRTTAFTEGLSEFMTGESRRNSSAGSHLAHKQAAQERRFSLRGYFKASYFCDHYFGTTGFFCDLRS